VYLAGDRFRDGGARPLMFSFEHGTGRVFYSEFHNSDQEDTTPLFEWLIQRL
jgi:hypothetical protein